MWTHIHLGRSHCFAVSVIVMDNQWVDDDGVLRRASDLGGGEFIRRAQVFLGPRAGRLMAYSVALREMVAMLMQRPRNDAGGRPLIKPREMSARWMAAFERLVADVHLDMRVRRQVQGVARLPTDRREAWAYMRDAEFVGSSHHSRLQSVCERGGTDPRVLCTLDRAIAEAASKGVPLWPTALAGVDGHGERGRSAQLGHGSLRLLPWSCWEAVEALVAEAGRATGYPLVGWAAMPGEFELATDCPAWVDPIAATWAELNSEAGSQAAGAAVLSGALRPKRLSREEARDERNRLLEFYSGGSWRPADGDDGTIEVYRDGRVCVPWVKPASYRPLTDAERLSKKVRRKLINLEPVNG